MCGLFGVVRSTQSDAEMTAYVFAALGIMSETRGRDAAGVAGFAPDGDVVFRTRRIGMFRALWPVVGDRRRRVERSQVLMGHTRMSSVGDRKDPRNIHPFRIGPVVGCHNGTMSRDALVSEYGLYDLEGTTDSEAIIAALASGPAQPESYLEVASSGHGSAALSFVDARRPDAVVLVRAASSPLAVARSVDGSLWWASLPEWFGSIGRHFDDYFDAPEILPEHCVATVSSHAVPQMERVSTRQLTTV
jgi:glucosamine 6-phosphate synthetase-like amidotransferase/phosphosugar isomerase protein